MWASMVSFTLHHNLPSFSRFNTLSYRPSKSHWVLTLSMVSEPRHTLFVFAVGQILFGATRPTYRATKLLQRHSAPPCTPPFRRHFYLLVKGGQANKLPPQFDSLILPRGAYHSLRNVVRAKMTTPMATARASTFWIMVEPESVPVTRAPTNSCTMIKTTSPMATEIKPLVKT